jgi:hypothetical protein
MADTIIIDDTGLGIDFFIADSMVGNPTTVAKVTDILDVDSTSLNNGSLLVYKTTTQKWTSTTTLEAQNLEGGFY